MKTRRRAAMVAGAVLSLAVATLSTSSLASATTSHELISGSGSSWSENAINQWIADVTPQGLKVVFTASGSAAGRTDFAQGTSDFGVSDIGYQGTLEGGNDVSNRAYALLPVVAGGTAFPYHIMRNGQLVRNLRLSGQTLTKIFTNQITNWDDPEITADNNGQALPSLAIVPVVHSEGSGASYMFTQYMGTVYPSAWTSYNGGSNAPTEFFPKKGNQASANGADGVMNLIASAQGNGSIGFDEYSYALAKNYPVAKVENSAGYFTLPNQYNVAVGLTTAKIDTTDINDPTKYLTQDLSGVYVNPDPRTYPISSYSYMIIPTSSTDAKMTTAKRQTLTDYLSYSICNGQAEMGQIGYSPLPLNLVQASFNQVAKLGQADPGVTLSSANVSSCNNPTFDKSNPGTNLLAVIAPQPAACDKAGAGPCTTTGDSGLANPVTTTTGTKVAPATASKSSAAAKSSTSSSSSGKSATGTSTGTAASGSGSGTGTSTGDAASGTSGTGSTSAGDPAGGAATTGQTAGASDTGSGGDGSGSGTGDPSGGSSNTTTQTSLAAGPGSSPSSLLGPLAVLLLLLVVGIPPFALVFARRSAPRKRSE